MRRLTIGYETGRVTVSVLLTWSLGLRNRNWNQQSSRVFNIGAQNKRERWKQGHTFHTTNAMYIYSQLLCRYQQFELAISVITVAVTTVERVLFRARDMMWVCPYVVLSVSSSRKMVRFITNKDEKRIKARSQDAKMVKTSQLMLFCHRPNSAENFPIYVR